MATRREPLSRERILQTAVAIVDREGLDALSMRRVGAELGVEAMSLYNHVGNKAALLDGVLETILDELPPLAKRRAWRATLRERGRALRDVLRAHPHALPLFATRPAVTPASLEHLESALGVLREAGFSPRDALSAFQVLYALVVGHTLGAYGVSREASVPDYRALDETAFPRVREAARALSEHDAERELDLGLDALLAGLEARLAKTSKR
jgi:AcrR family transcriptional regulator